MRVNLTLTGTHGDNMTRQLYAKLRSFFATTEQLDAWLETPNEGFGGSQPLQVIERGEIDRVWRMVYFLESGIPS